MSLTNISAKKVGVIGAGQFGTVISNLLAENTSNVLLYIRSKKKYEKIRKFRISNHQKLDDSIELTNDIVDIPKKCDVIFSIIPSNSVEKMIDTISPYLKPHHIIIHGTKGFNITQPKPGYPLTKTNIKTISQIIIEKTPVLRVGCISGPNLSTEINERKPAAAVIASNYDEVITIGRILLKNSRFMIYGSNDIKGTELCGILKNILAIGSGTLEGLDMGHNARAVLISRGLVEMIHIGKSFDTDITAFLGLAGIGDLVATCNSKNSRNFMVGYRISKGENLEDIIRSMSEVAEGIKTTDIIYQVTIHHKIKCPITRTVYRVLHNEITIKEAHTYLMNFPLTSEINFLKNSSNEDFLI